MSDETVSASASRKPDAYAVLLDDKVSAPQGAWIVGAWYDEGTAHALAEKHGKDARVQPIFFAPSHERATEDVAMHNPQTGIGSATGANATLHSTPANVAPSDWACPAGGNCLSPGRCGESCAKQSSIAPSPLGGKSDNAQDIGQTPRVDEVAPVDAFVTDSDQWAVSKTDYDCLLDVARQLERELTNARQALKEQAQEIVELRASARSAIAFTATHRHSDGALYQFVQNTKYKRISSEDWTDAVLYRDSAGVLYVTTPARWGDRFTPLAATESGGKNG